jgi:hypothetical protein
MSALLDEAKALAPSSDDAVVLAEVTAREACRPAGCRRAFASWW